MSAKKAETGGGGGVVLAGVLFSCREVSHCIKPDLVARSMTVYFLVQLAQCGMYSKEKKAIFSAESC